MSARSACRRAGNAPRRTMCSQNSRSCTNSCFTPCKPSIDVDRNDANPVSHFRRKMTKADPMSDSPARHLNLARRQQFPRSRRLSDGRRPHVRWRQIFRSNHLGHLTDAGHRDRARPRRQKRIRFPRRRGARGRRPASSRRSPCIRCRSSRRWWRHCAPSSPGARAVVGRCARDHARILSQLCPPQHAQLPRAVRPSPGGPRAAGDPLHRRQGPHRLCLRAGPACARRAGGRDRRGLSADQPLLPARPVRGTDLPDRCQAGDRLGRGLVPRAPPSMPSAPTMAISKAICGTGSASAQPSAHSAAGALSAGADASRRRDERETSADDQAAASISASRSAMTSSNAGIAC